MKRSFVSTWLRILVRHAFYHIQGSDFKGRNEGFKIKEWRFKNIRVVIPNKTKKITGLCFKLCSAGGNKGGRFNNQVQRLPLAPTMVGWPDWGVWATFCGVCGISLQMQAELPTLDMWSGCGSVNGTLVVADARQHSHEKAVWLQEAKRNHQKRWNANTLQHTHACIHAHTRTRNHTCTLDMSQTHLACTLEENTC